MSKTSTGRRRSVQPDDLALDPDVAAGVDLHFFLGLELDLAALELELLGPVELDLLRLDLDRLARLELEPDRLHLQHRALLGQLDPQLEHARLVPDLDQLIAALVTDLERPAVAQVDLALVGDLLGSCLGAELFLRGT